MDEATLALTITSLAVFGIFTGLFLWGLFTGQYRNIEEAKYQMLDLSEFNNNANGALDSNAHVDKVDEL